ncbi:MAG: hypothetical protein QOF76_115 [Solirubrobacteraceae bacterium]|nr:hypothetical protein [Solirubrobacteraceae bacterium]
MSFQGYLPRHRVLLARAAALLTVAGGTAYLVWRAQQLPHLGGWAWAFFGAEALTFLTLVSAVPLMWTPRPRRWAPPPQGSLDVFITVCGEDVDMVAATVRAALDIEYPHNVYILNDGRRAKADNWEAIDRLGERLGVPVFTRTTGIRGKAGNLNHALEQTDGDFVVVIDADHLARPDLADSLLGHFHPRVAFVATRQDFRIDSQDQLGNSEVFFYAVIQPAKDADNAAFSCGNGVAYRRAALDSIGGFSEWNLVEDLHTSYQLHAAGWHSVYVPRPVTTGTAPGTAAEMAAQRLRWATDSLRLFFWDNPFLKKGLTFRQKLHYGQTTGVYYLATAAQIVFLVCPAVTLFSGIEVLDPDSTWSYLAHLALFVVPMATMLVSFAGFRGALRLFQMQSFLAPVFCLAAWRAFWMRPGRKQHAFSGVTSKTRQQQVNRVTLVQHGIFLALLLSVGKELGDGDFIHWGAILWALVMAATLATQNSMVSLKWDIAQSTRIALTAPVAAGLVIVLIAIWSPFPGGGELASFSGGGTPGTATAIQKVAARTKLLPPRKGIYLGVYAPNLGYDTNASLHRYRGTRLRLVQRFTQWFAKGQSRYFDRAWADDVAARGGAPMITWEPWSRPPGDAGNPQEHPGILGDIADGHFDHYLRRWARDTADFRHPVVIRFAHEMNGSWYPWDANYNGNTPADYKAAFRHVEDVFDAAGARNVSWVWSIDTLSGSTPTSTAELKTYYPGKHYVDWVGLSGFNWGPESVYPSERSFLGTFKPAYEQLTAFGKPVMLSEIGTSALSADPAAWLRSALTDVAQLPAVKAIVWYDSDSYNANFRLTPSAVANLRDLGRTAEFRPRERRAVLPTSP